MVDEHGNQPLDNPDDDNLNRNNVSDHLAKGEHRWGMSIPWMRNHDKITRLIGILATGATLLIFGAILILAVFRQDSAAANDKRLVKLAEQNRKLLKDLGALAKENKQFAAELDCALDVSIKLPISGLEQTSPAFVAISAHRNRAIVRCLDIRGINIEDSDNAVDQAIEDTRAP